MGIWTVYETARDGISLFGPVHLLWLTAALIAIPLGCMGYRRLEIAERRRMYAALAAALVLDEMLKYAAVLAAGYPDVQYLPLHLCSLGMFAALGRAVRPSPEADEFLFAAALPGASAALIFPGWTALPAESILSVHSFSFHILLAAAAILPLSAGELRPDIRRLRGCAAMLAAMLLPLGMINRRFGTNFFFLAEPGEGNPLAALGALAGPSGYAAAPILCCAAVWAAMYGAQNLLRRFTPRRGCAIIK